MSGRTSRSVESVVGQGMDSGYPTVSDETTVMSTVASTPPSRSVIGRMTAAVGRLWWRGAGAVEVPVEATGYGQGRGPSSGGGPGRSEEHTSELQSR